MFADHKVLGAENAALDDDEAAMARAMAGRAVLKKPPAKETKLAKESKATATADKAAARDAALRAAAAADLRDTAKIAKRPAASVAGAKVAKATKIAHAGVVGSGGAKRPPAAHGSKSNPPSKVDYRNAFIYTSWTKLGYRVVSRPSVFPGDKMFTWSVHGGYASAWTAALNWIDAERNAGR